MQGLSTMQENYFDMKLSSISDASASPVCADGGVNPTWMTFGTMAYPEICCAECSGIVYYRWSGWPPPEDCGIGSSSCGGCWDIHASIAWARSPSRKAASTRHMGGSNVGFADGHAKWIMAAAITAMSDSKGMEKLGWNCSPGTSREGFLATPECGTPPDGMIFLYSKSVGWSGW